MQITDVYNDPYLRRQTAHKQRVAFNKLKRTNGFKHWRIYQLKVQKNKCAYCPRDLTKANTVTHVDHVQPLYFEGKNSYDNLVLACRRCNVRKWTSDRYVVPQWIKDNKLAFANKQRLTQIRRVQARQMKELVERELDEELANELRWI